ncbi:MAG: endonuclease MutS2, partial [Acidobacteriaceae bacterium]
MLPAVPSPLDHASTDVLEFPRLREMVAGYASTSPGREWTLALVPSRDAQWAATEQQRVGEALRLLRAGPGLDFHGLVDPGAWLQRARIVGAVLDVDELRALSALVGRFHAFQQWQVSLPEELREQTPSLRQLVAPLTESHFTGLIHSLDGKFEADGSIADHASPELARIRRQMERQQRAIEDSLRAMLRRLGPEGSLQEDL